MERFVGVLGLLVILLLAWSVSSNRRQIPWRVVGGGLALQFALAFFILRTSPGRAFFEAIDGFFVNLLGYVDAGAKFVFGEGFEEHYFAFKVLPTIIFFASLMAILYYFGIVQWIVKVFAWIMQKTLRTSGAETLAATANIFVGHTEAPLVVKPYLAGMTRSELQAVMVGGFSTITGGLMAAYVGMGISAGHLMTASVISAPAGLLLSKLMLPETGEPETAGRIDITAKPTEANVLEAATSGASDGLKLALNVAAMLIAFLALIAMFNGLVGWIGSLFGAVDLEGNPLWSLEAFFGWAFSPLAWLMGIESSECRVAGRFLGLKTVANEFIAYGEMSKWNAGEQPLSERTQQILTYALSGFSNLGAIGIQIGGIGALAPSRRADLAQLGLRAMFAGVLACSMTACVAGLLL